MLHFTTKVLDHEVDGGGGGGALRFYLIIKGVVAEDV